LLRESITILYILSISLSVDTAASILQSSPILKLFASDGGVNYYAYLPYIKPAFAIQTNPIPLGNNDNYHFYQHSYPSTSTSAIANQLMGGWVGRCLSTTTTTTTATTATPALLTAKLGTITNPLFSVLPGSVVSFNPYCSQYLQPYLNQVNKMNMFSQCVPATQWRNFIGNINNNFGLAPYCNSVVEGQEQRQANEAIDQSTGQNIQCISGQCQTSSSGTIGEPSGSSISQQTTCINNFCQTTTCISGKCQTSSSGTIGEPSGSSISQQTTCINNFCQTTTCISGKCQTSSSGTTAATTIGGQAREVNHGENIVAEQRVNQQANCAFGPGIALISCVNTPISINSINEGSNGIKTSYNNMPFLLPFP
jgi:hypothetical protein